MPAEHPSSVKTPTTDGNRRHRELPAARFLHRTVWTAVVTR